MQGFFLLYLICYLCTSYTENQHFDIFSSNSYPAYITYLWNISISHYYLPEEFPFLIMFVSSFLVPSYGCFLVRDLFG